MPTPAAPVRLARILAVVALGALGAFSAAGCAVGAPDDESYDASYDETAVAEEGSASEESVGEASDELQIRFTTGIERNCGTFGAWCAHCGCCLRASDVCNPDLACACINPGTTTVPFGTIMR